MLLFPLLFLAFFRLSKAKNCSIAKYVKANSTTADLTNKDCHTCWSEPCNKTGKIVELWLSYNNIAAITPGMFTCLKKLKILVLGHNSLTQIEKKSFSDLKSLKQLKLNNNRLQNIAPGAFDDLKLVNLVLGHNSLTQIEKNLFSDLKSLKQLKLNNNRLQNIAPGAFDDLKLVNLVLDHNELEEIPVFKKPTKITYLEISYNPIKKLDQETMAKFTKLESLILMNTRIRELPNMVFKNNTELRRLSLQDSSLEKIEPKAFEGIRLHVLNLSRTKISYLPGANLESLEYFSIQGVTDLWEIPIVSFKSLRSATVEYAFHCCLIHARWSNTGEAGTKGPISHNISNITIVPPCNKTTTSVTATSPSLATTTDPFDVGGEGDTGRGNHTEITELTLPPNVCVDADVTVVTPRRATPTGKTVICIPKADAFNPCGDLLESDALRVCSWIVLIFALLGNSAKMLVLIMSKRKFIIAKILMCNLAFANLCMGLFLCMLASADFYSLGEYQNFAVRWQYRAGCKVAGFASIFATELSVFVLTVITVERYFTIVHPLQPNKHLKTNQIIILMALGWVFSLTIAVLPLLPFEVSSYRKVAICLPFEVKSPRSKAYVTFLLATNGLAFFFVLFCYGRMYCSLGRAGSGASINRVERRVAKRMAMLVITNFACWFPIALVSLISIYGKTLIGVSAAQFFLVFVYPINSFTNPYLYAIGTKHFQLDALEIIERLGICNSAVKTIRNRIQDQLETLPTASRVTNESKISLNSVRCSNQTPVEPAKGNNESHNGSVKRNDIRQKSRSSRNSSACTSCVFLSIPSIHKINYQLGQKRKKSDSRPSLDNSSTETNPETLEDGGPDNMGKICARRASTTEVVLEGNILSSNKRHVRGSIANDSNENMPLMLEDKDFVKSGGEERQQQSSLIRVPTVVVTGC